jgi:hypothetical protein
MAERVRCFSNPATVHPGCDDERTAESIVSARPAGQHHGVFQRDKRGASKRTLGEFGSNAWISSKRFRTYVP